MGNSSRVLPIPRQVLKFGIFSVSTLLLTISLSGCLSLNDPEVSQENHSHVIGTITENKSVGQTLISRRKNLDNILIWYYIDPNQAPDEGVLTAKLYHSIGDQNPIKSYNIGFNRLINQNILSIPFQIRNAFPNQAYYLEISVNRGFIQIYGRDEDAYSDGEFYINQIPQNSDIGFRISYFYDYSSLNEDISTILNSSYLFIPIILMLWLPGRIFVEFLPINHELDVGERTALSIGTSMALIPIVMLWTSAANIKWRRESVVAVYILLALVFLWINRRKLRNLIRSSTYQINRNGIITGFLLIIFIITIITRVAMIRDLAAPAWVDSVHHAMITELIVDQGGYPNSYAPLIDISDPTYHPGFHGMAAVFQWLANLEVHKTLLIFGQVINSLCIFSVYLFTKTFTNNRLAALVSALIAGVVTPMPAYYTSWGRYTQLAGLLILPAIFVLLTSLWKMDWASRVLDRNKFFKNSGLFTLFTASMLLGGLYLTHYRVTAFLLTLIGAVLTVRTIQSIARKQEKVLLANLIDLVIIGIVSLVITLPWWPKSLTNLIIPRIAPTSTGVVAFSDFSWFYLTAALGSWALIAAAFGIIIGVGRRKSYIASIIIWILILLLFANLEALNLPGGGLINNTSVVIMLFFPISLLAGSGIAWIIELVSNWTNPPWKLVLLTCFGVIGIIVLILGAQSIIPIINPVTILFREADMSAMDWVAENIPEDEVVAINPFKWGYGLYAGIDGGYWLSPLAGRKTMPPPVLYGLNPDIGAPIVKTSAQILAKGDNVTDLHQYLLENGIEYIYVGARGGIFSPREMQASPLYNEIYSYKGTWVFQLSSN